MVVLGANANEIKPLIEKYPITIYTHINWAYGMGSSIAYGTEMIATDFEESDGVLVGVSLLGARGRPRRIVG